MKFTMALAILFSSQAFSATLYCSNVGTEAPVVYSAAVLGQSEITQFTEYFEGQKYAYPGSFAGRPNLNPRNPAWANYQIFEGLTGKDCIRGTCTTLVVPQNLLSVVGKRFPAYAVSTTDQAGGVIGLNCTVR